MSSFAETWRARDVSVPYVERVLSGQLCRERFVDTQLQFFHAVAAYPASLGVLAARLPDAAARAVLEENVHDEHGRGRGEDAHVETFRLLLERLGVSAARLAGAKVGADTRAFNARVQAACAGGPPEVGLAVIAAIEDLFTGISRGLGHAIAARGWLPADRIPHYSVHETLDRAHADALFAALESWPSCDGGFAARVARGFDHGGQLLLGYYAALLSEGRD